MLFNSWVFLFAFLPITLTGYFILGRRSPGAASLWLGLASLFFYGWWSTKALPLLLGSVILNYGFGIRLSRISRSAQQLGKATPKLELCAVLIANLALLGFFKYANFFIENANGVMEGLGLQPWAAASVILPIGISFYTFTQIAFLVDCWRGKVREPSLVHYLLFVTYFPHLIAGPVLHHAQMMPQFRETKTFRPDYDQIAMGIAIFVLGLGKKLLIADPLGIFADAFFEGISAGRPASFSSAWCAMLAYTMQIYFDFSGYSDMAVGLSLLFGIRLPVNFYSPYRARSIIEFWRRWHISLSNFLRDYLYVPLGGNRHGQWRRHLNLLITMLLGGLWHGASWTFVLWGAAHGMLLIVNHLWRSMNQGHAGVAGDSGAVMVNRIGSALAWPLTFVCVVFTWVLFRAESLSSAATVYQAMVGLSGFADGKWVWSNLSISANEYWRTLLLAILIAFLARPTNEYFELRTTLRANPVPADEVRSACRNHPKFADRWVHMRLFLVVGLFLLCLSRLGQYSPFLYFQF